MLQYNCTKNSKNAPRQIQNTTVKPFFICGQKWWKRITHLKHWFETRGEEVPLDRPYYNKKEKENRSHKQHWLT